MNFFSYLCCRTPGLTLFPGLKNNRRYGKTDTQGRGTDALFREHGPLFVRELVALAAEPKPHFNTLSTMVRALEAKGYVGHKTFGSTYQYYPVVTEEEFSRRTLGGVISKYFENSYLGAVSALVEEEKISVEDLRELIDRIENQNRR